jgi:hypothetical protein
MRLTVTTALLPLLWSVACTRASGTDTTDSEEPSPDTEPSEDASVFLLGEPRTCASPVEGFDRLTRVTAGRGLTDAAPDPGPDSPCWQARGSLIARDLDADGDIDLLRPRAATLDAWLNDGRGRFSRSSLEVDLTALEGRAILSAAAVDLDGDAHPDLVLAGEGFAATASRTAPLAYGPLQLVQWEADYPRACHFTFAVGDWQNDGDLDLLLPGLDAVLDATWDLDTITDPDDYRGTKPVLAWNAPAGWQLLPLPEPNPASLTAMAAFTDRDLDGDLDLLVGSDRTPWMPAMTSYRAEGDTLVEDSATVGFDLLLDAMGLIAADLDHDGDLDYCLSDEGPLVPCLLRGEDQRFYEAGALLGLDRDLTGHPDLLEGDDLSALGRWWDVWSIERVDLDGDGLADLVAASGDVPGGSGRQLEADAVWQGTATGFVDRSAVTGFWDGADHYGLVAEDFTGDGYPDLALNGPAGLELWDNPCGPGAWLRVELDGPGLNRDGWGARLELRAGEQTELIELHALRGTGQGSPGFHVGLGDNDWVDLLRITWPDGTVSEARDLPSRRAITVVHPDSPRVPDGG